MSIFDSISMAVVSIVEKTALLLRVMIAALFAVAGVISLYYWIQNGIQAYTLNIGGDIITGSHYANLSVKLELMGILCLFGALTNATNEKHLGKINTMIIISLILIGYVSHVSGF